MEFWSEVAERGAEFRESDSGFSGQNLVQNFGVWDGIGTEFRSRNMVHDKGVDIYIKKRIL